MIDSAIRLDPMMTMNEVSIRGNKKCRPTKTAMIQTNKHPACIAWAISMNLLRFVEVYTFSLIIYAVRDVFTLVFPSHTNIAKNGKDKEERGYHHKHRCRSVGTSEQFQSLT